MSFGYSRSGHIAKYYRHHPFTAFTRARHVKGKVPGSYLQNSYNTCRINSNWTALLLQDMDKTRVSLYDPLVGYFVAISATVLLDRTLRKHDEKQEAVEQKFRLCYEYIKRMSFIWKSMANVVSTLSQSLCTANIVSSYDY